MDANNVLKVLKQVEWVYIEQARDYTDTCPLCSVAKPSHQRDCELAALIVEVEKEAQAESNGDSLADRIWYWQKRAILAEQELRLRKEAKSERD